MKRLLALLAVSMIVVIAVSAAPLANSLQQTQSWTASGSEKGVQLRVYDEDGKLEFMLSGNTRVDFDVLNLSLMVRSEQKTYVFAVDTWMSDNGHYAVLTRDGHTIMFVDFAIVSNPKTKTPNVKIYGLYN